MDAFDVPPCGQVSTTMFAASSAPVRDSRVEPILAGPAAGWMKREQAIMGTAIVVELWSDDAAAGEAAIDAVMAEMHRIDRTMSPHKDDSELTRINRGAGSAPVRLSDEMTSLLARAESFARLTGGAFDITYAAVGHLYDYRAGIRPSAEALARACRAVGWRLLTLDRGARTVRFTRPGMRIDLGGFAKGYAVDNATRILRAHGHPPCHGQRRRRQPRHRRPRGRPWTIGIRDPRGGSGDVVAVLPARGRLDLDLRRLRALLRRRRRALPSPHRSATGRSPASVRSVTVLAEDGLTSEALSKAVFVLGVAKGLALIDSFPGVDAIVVDAAGALHYSAGLVAPAAAARP
jgi:thiamine biosynthesis lipoprotein